MACFYVFRVINVFAYLGYPSELVVGWEMILSFVIVLGLITARVDSLFHALFRWVVLYPLLIVLSFGSSVLVPIIISSLFYFIMQIRIGEWGLKNTKVYTGSILYLLSCFTLILAVAIIYRYGAFIGFDLNEIYEKRSLVKGEITGIWSYVYHILLKGLIPGLVVVALDRNRIALAGIFLIIGLIIATIFFQKSVVGIYILALLGLKILDVNKRAIQMSVLVLLVLPLIMNSIYIDAVVTRIFFDAALIREGYWLHLKEPLYYSSSVLEGLIPYEYGHTPANYIGMKTFGDSKMNANIGFPSDTLMNLGSLSWIGLPFNLVLFKLLEKTSRQSVVAFIFCANFMFTRFSGEFFTVLITHGLFVFLLIIYKFKLS